MKKKNWLNNVKSEHERMRELKVYLNIENVPKKS